MAASDASGSTFDTVAYFDEWSKNYEKSMGRCTRDLAARILDLLPPLHGTSILLDNAAGPGVVTSEVLKRAPHATIHAVDASPNMTELAKGLYAAGHPNVTFATVPGEELSFPDNTFTHSVTNQGILFFADGPKGAAHIFRTLKPGAVAAVSSWERLGYVPYLQDAWHAVRPDLPAFSLPIQSQWFQRDYLEQVMRGAGFKEVEIVAVPVFLDTDNLGSFLDSLKNHFPGWTEDQLGRLRELFIEKGQAAGEPFKRHDSTEGLGLPMDAIVAVCRK